jgi:hypothetical protein
MFTYTCCWMLQTLNFNIVDVEFRCYTHVMLGFVSRVELLMLDVTCITGRDMVAI